MIFRMTLVHSGSACDADATNGGWKRCGGGKHWERLPQVDECGSFQDSGLQHRMMKLLSNGCWKKRCLRITKDPQKAEWFIVVLYGSVGREIILESLSLGELISFHLFWSRICPIKISVSPLFCLWIPWRQSDLSDLAIWGNFRSWKGSRWRAETRRNIAFVAPGMVACFPELGLRWQQRSLRVYNVFSLEILKCHV